MTKDGFIKNDAGEWVFRVHEDRKFTRGYEVAAWYDTIAVPAGDYPAVFRTIRGGEVDGPDAEGAYWVYASLDGRLTYTHTPSLWCGVQIGDGGSGERDEPTKHIIQSYAFSVRDKAAA